MLKESFHILGNMLICFRQEEETTLSIKYKATAGSHELSLA